MRLAVYEVFSYVLASHRLSRQVSNMGKRTVTPGLHSPL